jgi:hypothetical protein
MVMALSLPSSAPVAAQSELAWEPPLRCSTEALPISDIRIIPEGRTKIFDREQKVEYSHVPDAFPHAYRDALGKVFLTQTHMENYRMAGSNLLELEVDPIKTYSSLARSSNPEESYYDYHQWVVAPYTLDGRTFYALNHHEWYACLRDDNCEGQNRMNSWVSSITQFKSTDGGATWSKNAPCADQASSCRQAHVVIRPAPWGDQSYEVLNHHGMFMSSRIIKEGDYYYAVIGYIHRTFTPPAPQGEIDRIGSTIIRTRDVTRASDWEVWQGGSRYGPPVEPLEVIRWDLQLNATGGTLTYDLVSCQYILLFYNYDLPGKLWYMTSSSLASPRWSDPRVVTGSEAFVTDERRPDHRGFTAANYSSIIDPASPGLNFEFTRENPYLFYITPEPTNSHFRDMYRVPLQIEHAP